MLNTPATISVIIPALNEARFIGRCLASLTEATYPKGAWEVIVVDNGSHDDTVKIARSFSSKLDIRVFENPALRVSGQRNFGARMAKGERLIFLDADCVAPSNWLETSVELGRSGGAVLLGAPFLLPRETSWVARVWWEFEQRTRGAGLSYLSAHNLHIQRDVFLSLEGFDETLDTNEDYAFSQKVLSSGGSIAEDPRLSVTHLGNPETLRQYFRRERWHGRDVFRVFVRDLGKRHNLRAVAFAGYTLACMVGVALGVAAVLVFGSWYLAATSATALAAAPAALAVRAAAVGSTRHPASLALLFLVYGIARAVALLEWGRTSQRKLFKVATSS